MAKRRTTTDWSWLRWLIESNLRRQPGFPKDLRLETRLATDYDGLCHDNYFFAVAGQGFVLRLAKRFRSLRGPAESRKSLPREAETLQRLAECNLPFPVPRLVCTVTDESGVILGIIESCLDGAPLSQLKNAIAGCSRLEVIAEVAAQVHRLPKAEFPHVAAYPDSDSHVGAELNALPTALLANWPVAAAARDWIVAHRANRPSVALHGDLLPQNLLCDILHNGRISVIDWECMRIGDPAYDLAIVTRGARKPQNESGGFDRMLAAYNAASETSLPASAVRIHELLLHLQWLAETARQQATGKLDGHRPDHYAQMLGSLLRRIDSRPS